VLFVVALPSYTSRDGRQCFADLREGAVWPGINLPWPLYSPGSQALMLYGML
jgi:hypothetical protein